MIKLRRIPRLLSWSMLAMLYACFGNARVLSSRNLVPTTRHAPDEFGIQDYTVTTISAMSFTPTSDDTSHSPNYFGQYLLGRGFLAADPNYCLEAGRVGDLWATVNIPSGAVIDYIGLETNSPADGVWGVALFLMDRYNNQAVIGSFSSSAHGWDTDYNSVALGFQLVQNTHNQLVLQVEEAGTAAGCPVFAWVEIWWRRTVTPAPATASFNDVPTSHPFFQYIEALKASGITAGCQVSPPLYCPDSPLTRGQMAVFLAKALGLHWGL